MRKNANRQSRMGRTGCVQCVFHTLIKLHDCSLVAATVAVVRCREDGNHGLIVRPVITFHDKLMRTRDQCEAIGMIEMIGDICNE